jgi:hypothetical protein
LIILRSTIIHKKIKKNIKLIVMCVEKEEDGIKAEKPDFAHAIIDGPK